MRPSAGSKSSFATIARRSAAGCDCAKPSTPSAGLEASGRGLGIALEVTVRGVAGSGRPAEDTRGPIGKSCVVPRLAAG
jgi:hypothetical protein